MLFFFSNFFFFLIWHSYYNTNTNTISYIVYKVYYVRTIALYNNSYNKNIHIYTMYVYIIL